MLVEVYSLSLIEQFTIWYFTRTSMFGNTFRVIHREQQFSYHNQAMSSVGVRWKSAKLKLILFLCQKYITREVNEQERRHVMHSLECDWTCVWNLTSSLTCLPGINATLILQRFPIVNGIGYWMVVEYYSLAAASLPGRHTATTGTRISTQSELNN